MSRASSGPVLSVRDLAIADAGSTKLVHGVSFDLEAGGTLGIVGESGSGKSLTCRALLGVLPAGLKVAGGGALYKGTDLTRLDRRGWRPFRGTSISAVFQDPGSYLNPSIPVGRQLAEAVRATLKLSRAEAQRYAIDLLARVGLHDPEAVYGQYPFELSGGMLQRVLIAIAVSAGPDLLIADEATTALDVTVQAEILDLLAELQREQGLALILVSHDLAVVAQVCEQVIVMRHGAVIEAGPTARVLTQPRHEYTRSLVKSHAAYGIDRISRRRHGPTADTGASPPLLEIEGVEVTYGRGRSQKRILHSIDLTVGKGEILGLIGETGSGKTTLLRAVLGVAPLSAGRISFAATVVSTLDQRSLRKFRRSGQLQYVFQDPLQSLNPDITVGRSIIEGLEVQGRVDRDGMAERLEQVLRIVGLGTEFAERLPRELSGGQRQRVVIARALILEPAMLLLDEPVSALDAAARVQILALLESLGRERGIAQIFISHDLGSVAGMADRVAVLYRGRIVELGPTADVLNHPQHPYTQRLIASAPRLGPAPSEPLVAARRADPGGYRQGAVAAER